MNQPNYNLLVWNIRGLNSGAHRDALRGVVQDANASVVCVQETKLSVISPFLINEMLGTRFSSFAYLPAAGASGGVLIACRDPDFSMTDVACWEIFGLRPVASQRWV